MRRFAVPLVFALFALLFVSVVAVAQSTLRLLPAVVNVNQVVPTTLTMTGVVNGQAVTLTSPVNVTVAMQIKLESTGVAVTGQASAQQAQPTQTTQTYYDARNIPYRVDVRPPFSLLSVTSSVNALNRPEIVGEIKNIGTQEMQFVKAVVTFYKGGRVSSTNTGYTSLDRLAVGQSSPFKVVALSIPGDGFDAYMIQVDGSPAR